MNNGKKKLNFHLKDFKKSDAHQAGFKAKGLAIKFFKITPKNKLSNFSTVNELKDYIKSQKEKIDKLGLAVDKQKPRLTKEKKQYNQSTKELETKLKDFKGTLSKPDEIENDTFIFDRPPQPNDILRCANKFYKNNSISIPKNHDYVNLKKKHFIINIMMNHMN